MARTRYIKPGFFENEDLAALPPVTRLLFAGLWLTADKKGRQKDVPMKIKGQLFPYDNTPVERHLKALADAGFINRYEVDGVKVLWVPTFLAHQHPHPNEANSTLPAHPQYREILASLHITDPDPDTYATDDQGYDVESHQSHTNATAESGRKGKGMGNGSLELELGKETGEPERSAGPNGAAPSSPSSAASPDSSLSPSLESIDFIRDLYDRELGRHDPWTDEISRQIRTYLREGMDSAWIAAAIHQAASADKPGFGYLKRTLDDCAKKKEPPSSLRRTARAR